MGKLIVKTLIKAMTKKMDEDDQINYARKKDVQGVLEKTNIIYEKQRCMDCYIPEHQTINDRFYIVDIHGGAWIYGDKKINRHFCMHLAKRGFLTFNINYDLIPDVTVKQQVQQIVSSLRYIRQHAEEFGIQHQKLCLAGDSAGAHLASLITAICQDKKLQEAYEVDCHDIFVHALLLQHGIYNLEPMKHSDNLYMKKLYQWMFPKKDHIAKDCLWPCLDTTWQVPMFLLSSAKDETFSKQTLLLSQRLDELHLPYELLYWEEEYQDLRHVFHIAFPDLPESQTSIDRMVQYLHHL